MRSGPGEAGDAIDLAIADALGLSVGAIKNHVSVILARLQTSDRTKAVLRALRDGLL